MFGFFKKEKLKRSDIMMLFEHVASLMREVPMVQAVRIWEPPEKNVAALTFKRQLYNMMSSGVPFVQALSRFVSGLLSPMELLILRIGEANGNLDSSLDEVVKNYKANTELRKQTISSLTMPIITLIAGFGALILGIYVIIPKYEELFLSFVQYEQLPDTTRFIIDSSRFIRNNTIPICVAIAMLIGLLQRTYSFILPKKTRNVIWRYASYLVFSSLYILVKVGIPFQEAIRHIERSIPAGSGIREYYRLKVVLKKIYNSIYRGISPDKAFRKYGQEFGSVVLLYVDIAINAGTYEDAFNKASKHLRNQYIQELTSVVKLIQPVTLFITAGFVALLLFALWMPMFQLASAVGS
ncbi:MAG: type II secretion system F family protein [Nitrososphaerota archaeon]